MKKINLADLAAQGGRKRIFLGLLAASCIALCLLLLIFFILPWLGTGSVWLGRLSMTVGVFGIVLLVWLCVTIVFHVYTGRNLPGISWMRHLCIRLFLPFMELAGRIIGLNKNLVRRSFIKVNNEFVMAQVHEIETSGLLLLLPHCIQASSCKIRLGASLEHCAECGGCQIAHIRVLSKKYGFCAAIATGGTVARRIVAEQRPKAIIAVACERDLTAGIQDSYPVPVFGILNERPNGPCKDTFAPVQALHSALAFFLGCSSLELDLSTTSARK